MSLCLVNIVNAKVNNLYLENLAVEHGLPQGSVSEIFQDDEGFIWFCTETGLNIYDGYSFRSLAGPDNELDRYAVYRIMQDKEKLLWLNVAIKGIFTYEKGTDKYQKILASDPKNSDYYLVDMVEGEKDDIFIASSKTIILYNKASKKSTRILDLSTVLPTKNTNILEVLLDGDVLYIATHVGVYAFNVKSKLWKKLPKVSHNNISPQSNININSNRVYNLHISSNKQLFLGTHEGVYSLLVKNINNYLSGELDLSDYKIINQEESSWEFFADGDDLYHSSHIGLSVIDTKLHTSKFLFSFNDFYKHIKSTTVVTVIKDRKGMFWLGSDGTGVYKWDPTLSIIKNYRYNKGDENSLTDHVIWGITEQINSDEQLWVGTKNGLNSINTETGEVKKYLSINQPMDTFHESTINKINEDFKQRLWLNTPLNVLLFDIKSKKLIDIPYSDKVKELMALPQRSFFYDHYDHIWSITELGVNRISLKNGEIDPLDDINDRVSEDKIYTVLGFLPNSEKMLFSTNNSLWYFDLETRKNTLVYKHPNIADSQWSYIESVVIDNKGVLWFSFSGYGITGIDAETFEQKHFFHQGNSIIGNFVYGLLIDPEDDLWFSSHNGIYMINTTTQEIHNFDTNDGLIGNEFNSNSFYKLNNNTFAYGAMKGLSVFDPIALKRKNANERLDIHATNIKVLSRDLPLPFVLNTNETIELRYDDVGVRIDFSPLTFRNTRKILFEYKLQGSDNVQYPLTTKNHITFSSLPSGKHSLIVRIQSIETKKYSEEFILHFDVSYAPWLSPLAYAIYCAVLLSIFFLWYSKRQQYTREILSAHKEVQYRENRLQLALTGSNSEVWDWQSNDDLIFAKRASEELGYSNLQNSYSLEQHLALIHKDERDLFQTHWLAFLNAADVQASFAFSYRMKKNNGEWLWFKDLGKIVSVDKQGKALRITGAYTNITQSQADAERAQFYGDAFKKTKDWVLILCDDFRRVVANESIRKAFDWNEEEFSFDANLFGLNDERFSFYLNMFSNLKSGSDWRGEELIKTSKGEEYHVIITVSASFNKSTNSTYFVCIFTDISAQKHAEEELRHLANYDHLTKLPNRAFLLDRIKHAIDCSTRKSLSIALLFIDLDKFKQVNDTLGHDCGDLLLQEISNRLTASLRVEDTVARIGGDEFVVLLESFQSYSELVKIAQKIIDTVGQPIELKGIPVYVGASIGISLLPDDANDCDELLHHADVAMYHSKQLGRNTFQFYTPRMNVEATERLNSESKLKSAFENNEFINHYQPIVDSYLSKAVGAELLLRWQSGKKIIPPRDFISLSEDLGLIIPMTEAAILRGIIDLKKWRAIRPDFYLSINLSERHFLQNNLVPYLQNILKEHDLPPEALKFEVTESMCISDPDKTIESMKALDKLGVSLTLDDFGTGYSSLTYLQSLPLKTLKIDRSFISGVGVKPSDETIVTTILSLAKNLNMECIAEGVENEKQLEYLGEKHCHLIQGYLYSKAVEAAKIEQHLLEDAIEFRVIRSE